jgi:pyruvate formate lyase activating enzyme
MTVKRQADTRILAKTMSRREFLKRGVIGLAALGLGGYAASRLLSSPQKPDLSKFEREAYYYKKRGQMVTCQSCPHGCSLSDGDRGICRAKVNRSGTLVTQAYGNPCAVHTDPIEKKPLFHFLPGTLSYSIATAGCNFRCKNCQNWQISQSTPLQTQNMDLMPEQVVSAAKVRSADSISYTYSEPSIFYEYMYDTSKLAREAGLKNVWVTNGYLNKKPLTDLCTYMDAANVDVKAFDESTYEELCQGSLAPVLETLKTLKENKVWFEVTNLVVPTYTDKIDMVREMSQWLYKNLGPDYPLHFSRFAPLYQLVSLPPTDIGFLEKARKVAQDEGLNYVYIGNAAGAGYEDTICPKHGEACIEREGFAIKRMGVSSDGICAKCGERIAGVWQKV